MFTLRRHWFLITLAALIGGGIWLGASLEPAALRRLVGWIVPNRTTPVVLFLTAFSLDSRLLWHASFRRPGPFLLGSLINLGLMPLMAWGLAPFQLLPDFRAGLMIAASVPCTLATAAVWTRRAGGNDAVVLLVTLATNGLCCVVTPLWLSVSTGRSIAFDGRAMTVALMTAAVLPIVVGQAARLIPGAALFESRRRGVLGGVSQGLVLLLVFAAACEAGRQVAKTGTAPSAAALAVVIASAVGVHVAGLAAGGGASVALGFPRTDAIAVALAGSQKTLPIGLLIATDPAMFGNPDLIGPGQGLPFVVFPMVIYHTGQLFLDTAIAARMGAWAKVTAS